MHAHSLHVNLHATATLPFACAITIMVSDTWGVIRIRRMVFLDHHDDTSLSLFLSFITHHLAPRCGFFLCHPGLARIFLISEGECLIVDAGEGVGAGGPPR